MNILSIRYEAWFSSYQSSKIVYGGREFTQHLHNHYQKVFLLFGFKIWTKKYAVEEVPVYAWTQRAASGFTDFKDEFRKQYPRFTAMCDRKKTRVLWAV